VQKSATILERLERLKNVKDFTWEQLAEKLDLSVSMLMQVKSGDRQLSPRALFRLDCAEKMANLRYPEPVRWTRLGKL
jgi:transcriptional regulator with XRE-family HTH domain